MYFAVISFALASTFTTLTTIGLTFFGIAALVMIFSIAFDIKIQRRERALGKEVIWYKRNALLGGSAGLCFMLSETLFLLMINNTLPHTLFFYLLVSLLIICSLCLAIYSLKLALKQRKVAREQLKIALDRQKAQRSE